jgi:hypothetical protein
MTINKKTIISDPVATFSLRALPPPHYQASQIKNTRKKRANFKITHRITPFSHPSQSHFL